MKTDDNQLCQYVYKTCNHIRSRKKDGSLHRLCTFHRQKANALQKAYATKRRSEMRLIRKEIVQKKKIQQKIQQNNIPIHMKKSEPIPSGNNWFENQLKDDDFKFDDLYDHTTNYKPFEFIISMIPLEDDINIYEIFGKI